MISLFTKQLHQLLAQQNVDHLHEVSVLLSSHLGGKEKPQSEEEKTITEIAECICMVLKRHRDSNVAADKKRRAKAVRAIINSLSFSELEAATHIIKTFDQNDKSEGILVAGNIADKLGFARSVITGTLRKLEGASLIETRSLGMKGTYIKIKDSLLVDELRKL